jgi:hypothetical protein
MYIDVKISVFWTDVGTIEKREGKLLSVAGTLTDKT